MGSLRLGFAVPLLVAASVLPFLPGFPGAFVEDDLTIIRDHEGLRSWRGIPAAFTETYWRGERTGGLYRPITVASYAVDHAVWGEAAEPAPDGGFPPWPGGIRLTNLLLHALATLLLFAILRRHFPDGPGALVGALIFAVHPVHVEPVVHLVGRADLLAAVFVLAGFWWHRRGGRLALAVAPALYFFALLSKEIGAVLPGLLLAEGWLVRDRSRGVGVFLRRQLRELAPYLGVLVLYLGIRGLVLGASLEPPRFFALYVPGDYVAFQDPRPGEVLLTMLHAAAEYLRLLVFPWSLSADYSGFPHHTSVGLAVVASSLVLLAVVAGAWVTARRGEPRLAVWVSWLFVALIPVSNLLVVTGVVMAERVFYLPSAAAGGLAALAFAALATRIGPRGALTVAAVVIGLFAVHSARRAPVWSHPLDLFEATVESRFCGTIGLNGLVQEYLLLLDRPEEERRAILEERGIDADEARLESRALELARRSVELHRNLVSLEYLARLLDRTGQPEESRPYWEALRRYDPTSRFYAGRVSAITEGMVARRLEAGDTEGALREALAALEAVGGTPLEPAWRERVSALRERFIRQALEAGEGVAALERVLAVERSQPGDPLVQRYKRTALEAAIQEFRRRIVTAVQAEDWVVAAQSCMSLEKLRPEDPVFLRHRTRALEGAMEAYLAQGNQAVAREIARKILSFDPRNPAARSVLPD